MLVETAGTGTQAVMRMMTEEAGHFDYVLMDLMMPEMNGFEAARVIRALPEKARAEVPIIAMTAATAPEDRRKAAEAGMDAFTEKPLQLEKLFGIMSRLKSGRR